MDRAVLLIQEPVFNDALSRAPLDVPWRVDQHSARRLPRRWLRPFRRWNLCYYVARVASIPDYPYREASTSIAFKIWARDAPQRVTWSFNALDATSFVRPGEHIDATFIPNSNGRDGVPKPLRKGTA